MNRLILYALALVSWVAIFWVDLPVLVHFWNGEDYSHCYLIVPIIIYLVWNNRSRIAEASGGSGFFGYLLLLISILFLFIGRFGSLRYFVNLSMWTSFCGMALVGPWATVLSRSVAAHGDRCFCHPVPRFHQPFGELSVAVDFILSVRAGVAVAQYPGFSGGQRYRSWCDSTSGGGCLQRLALPVAFHFDGVACGLVFPQDPMEADCPTACLHTGHHLFQCFSHRPDRYFDQVH